MSVDLPEPDGPMTAVNWPAGSSSETPRRACTAESPSPYVRVSARGGDGVAVAVERRGRTRVRGPFGERVRRAGRIARRCARRPAVQGTGGQQGGRRLGEQPAGEAAGRRTDTDARTSLPPATGGELVVDVEAHGAVGREREPAVGCLVDLHVEPDALAGEPPADAGAAAGGEPPAVELLDVEGQRRPAGESVRVGEHVEHGLRAGVGGRGGGPCPHGADCLACRGVACRRPP